jgi:energy-coupling factor transporter ATP-binding protein EcfA2
VPAAHETGWREGSRWLRWDPHIHTPGTLRNNQFGSDWDAYVRRINEATPPVVALGVTDYFSLRGYREVRRRWRDGAFQHVALVFPNIELRLTVQTDTGVGVNAHLFVRPDDDDHVDRLEEKLRGFTFIYDEERFACCDRELIRLGRQHAKNPALEEEAALREGANQFKIEFSALYESLKSDQWFQKNVLLAVASGRDGLGGLPTDAGFHAQKESIARAAHIILSGNPSDRRFWLGHHPDFERRGLPRKPCLHGCDAHDLDRVLAPDLDRFCWIRGAPTFDGLCQTLVEPERRVFIDVQAPQRGADVETISELRVLNAPWFPDVTLRLNDGLVTIIGPKGSGKTALAEFIAFAASAQDETLGAASFVRKAGDLLDGVQVELIWADGAVDSAEFGRSNSDEPRPRVRYLSQQFVERLCDPKELAEPLVEEIEAVVFGALPEEDRMEAATFADLRRVRVSALQDEQDALRTSIAAHTRSGSSARLTSSSRKRVVLDSRSNDS